MVIRPLEPPAVERLTGDEFDALLALPENRHQRLELIDGEVIRKPMATEEHGYIGGLLATYLNMYLFENPMGRVVLDGRYRPLAGGPNSRLPDLAVVLNDEARPLTTQGAAPFMPDLCVEIQSPDDSLKTLLDKAQFYPANGARMVWLVYPHQRMIEVLTARSSQMLGLNDTLPGGEVLPGFSVPVARLFPA